MRLIALQDVSDPVGVIAKGRTFVCLDPDRIQTLISTRMAQPETERRFPLDWAGRTVFILASGPSLTQEQCDAVRGKGKVIAINTTFRLAPWADVLYGCDGRWWDEYHSEAKATSSELWTQEASAAKKHGLKFAQSRKAPGLGKQFGVIHQGANSGYQAINLAYQAGVKRIVLLGFDMKRVGGKSHHHGDHPRHLNSSLPFAMWIREFAQLAKDLEAAGVETINCTPGSALKCFRAETLEAVLA